MEEQLCVCLDNAISLRDICVGDDDCTLYVNDLPGISERTFTFLRSDDFPLPADVFNMLKKRAIVNTSNVIRAAINKRFEVKTIMKSVLSGTFDDPLTSTVIDANKLIGFPIDLRYSKNLELRINWIEVYSDIALAPVFEVWDLETGVLLDLIPSTDTGPGFLKTIVNRKYTGRERLFVGYNAEFSSYKVSSFPFSYYSDNCNYRHTCSCSGGCSEFDAADARTENNLKGTNECGIIICWDVLCSMDAFICNEIDAIREILWYTFGLETMAEIMSTKRINEDTLMSDEEWENTVNYYKGQREIAIMNWQSNLNIDDPVCAECLAKVRRVHTTP